MDEFDNNVNLPKNFDLYVEKIKVSHKLIIKSKNVYHCDYCNSDFKKKRITKKLYGEKLIKCPICKQTLIVKSNRIKNYIQKDNFCIIERFKGYYIFRLFQVETTYRNGNYSSHICEFGRKLFDDNFGYIYEIYNDNISATISGKYVNHKEFLNFNWKRNGSYYHTLGDVYKLYPYNLKKLFKGTKWQYSQIWDFAKHITYFDISNFMYSYSNSIEYLIKNRLYILTNNLLENTSRGCILKLDYKYIKQNLKFIRKYNLRIDEITLMQYFNIFDIKLIRKYSEYADNLIDILHELNIKLELVDKYVDLYFKSNLRDLNETLKYVIGKLKESTIILINNLLDELSSSKFNVLSNEFKIKDISSVIDLDNRKIIITGIVDRIDYYIDENNFYYRVIDYKTGVKKFRLDDVLIGLNMQMIIYLMAIYNSNISDKNIIPTGFLYHPALVHYKKEANKIKKEESINSLKDSLKANGIINSNYLSLYDLDLIGKYLDVTLRGNINDDKVLSTNEFNTIFKYIKELLKKEGNSILSGEIYINPIKDSKNDSCKYCKFSSICNFDENKNKPRRYKSIKNREALSKMEGEDSGMD